MHSFLKSSNSFYANSTANSSELDQTGRIVDDSSAEKTNFSAYCSTDFFKEEKGKKINPFIDPVLDLSWEYGKLDIPTKTPLNVGYESDSGKNVYYKQIQR